MNNKLINVLKNYFVQEKNVSMAFLFGSAAKNRTFKESDIDIAVYLKNNNKRNYHKIWNDIEDLVHYDVDLVNLNDTYPSLAFEAIRGIKLKIKDESFFVNYMINISQEAVDFQEFILDFWKQKKKLEAA
ncbi:MAG: nucleotidyltransferase domain-containing protein [bacterium]